MITTRSALAALLAFLVVISRVSAEPAHEAIQSAQSGSCSAPMTIWPPDPADGADDYRPRHRPQDEA